VTVDTSYAERWRQLKEARAVARGSLPGSWQLDQRLALQQLADKYVELRMAQARASAG